MLISIFMYINIAMCNVCFYFDLFLCIVANVLSLIGSICCVCAMVVMGRLDKDWSNLYTYFFCDG